MFFFSKLFCMHRNNNYFCFIIYLLLNFFWYFGLLEMVSLCKGCKTGPCYQNIPGLPCVNAEYSNENNRICLLSRTKGILTIMFTNTPHFQVYRLLGLNCFATVFTYRSGFMFSLCFKIWLLSSSHTEHLFINKLKLLVQAQEFLMWSIHHVIVFWLGLLVQIIHCKLPFNVEALENGYFGERLTLCTKEGALMSYCCLFFYNIIDWVQ